MSKRILFLFFLAVPVLSAKAGIFVLNGLTHLYKVENGQVLKGKVQIQNTADHPQDVKIYLQDLSYFADGRTLYIDPQTNEKSNAGWVKLNTNLITLKGKEKLDIFYEITVPQNVTDIGTYWSVLIIEPTQIIESAKQTGVTITNTMRYAIQLITNVQPEKAKTDLNFERVDIEINGTNREVKLAVANKGTLYTRPVAGIEIFDRITGSKVGSFQSGPMGLLPSTSKMFTIDISAVNPGNYSAVLLLSDQNDNAFAMNIDLELKE
ncbi:hypothetical protein [Arundinibacter roseus]|uniref:DUF3324 domain-containing protein n=1 Tax=Arundinibacter roseus TaxID=2070510 RepID=A0A4R4JZG3_9BACT|nr:hypothetical protein [Arundinibacter roseus]TDB59536.1 hypothetical protein EZE20_22290 [Arundinibacter roseus]